MKKKFIAIIAGILMLLLFATCGTAAPATDPSGAGAPAQTPPAAAADAEQEPITLRFLHKWPEPEFRPWFDALVESYMELNPHVTIIAEAAGDDPIKDLLRIVIGTDQQPDVFFAWSGEFANNFVRAGVVLDLTPHLDADGGAWRNTFMRAGLEPYEMDGRNWGIPIRVNSKVFVYNEALFAEHGLTAPETWDEFLYVAQTFRDAGITPIGFGNASPWAACHYITGLNQKMVPHDVRLVDYYFMTGEFTHPGYVAAHDMFLELHDLGFFNPYVNSTTHSMAREAWFMGESAMFYLSLGEFRTIAAEIGPDGWGFFPMPEIPWGEGRPNYLVGAPDGFLVSAFSQHPEQAIDFLQYMTNMENAVSLIQEIGWPSAVIGAVEAADAPDWLIAGVNNLAEADGMALWLDTDIHIRIADVWLPGLQELLEGTITSEELMQRVQAIAQEVRATYE
ncbi:MAG: extracellular solute-binding protein [Clostridiales bacterium]|jgi:raffinose/stachyose/melibiose transport system substrate-binding protein|nr:extracellular solute-binding protein [Clostridiales bacterium]